jgi:hypothetical protein
MVKMTTYPSFFHAFKIPCWDHGTALGPDQRKYLGFHRLREFPHCSFSAPGSEVRPGRIFKGGWWAFGKT